MAISGKPLKAVSAVISSAGERAGTSFVCMTPLGSRRKLLLEARSSLTGPS